MLVKPLPRCQCALLQCGASFFDLEGKLLGLPVVPCDFHGNKHIEVMPLTEALSQGVQVSGGGGSREFPYNRIAVKVVIPRGADKAPFTLALDPLEAKIRERFNEIRCHAHYPLDVDVTLLNKAPAAWTAGQRFSVTCHQDARRDQITTEALPSLRVDVVHGTTAKKNYRFDEAPVRFGRGADLLPSAGGRRRNDVAFEQSNTQVSRAHATIVFDAARKRYRLLDDGSAAGTQITRGRETIDVPRGDPRGVLLFSGDLIAFGDATVRVTIG